MKAIGIIITIILFIFSIKNAAFGQTATVTQEECREILLKAAQEFITQEFPNNDRGEMIIRANDFICSDQEYMANVLIVISGNSSLNGVYGMFHVHFTPQGKLISFSSLKITAGGNRWKPIDRLEDPNREWCEFIKSVYKELCFEK